MFLNICQSGGILPNLVILHNADLIKPSLIRTNGMSIVNI